MLFVKMSRGTSVILGGGLTDGCIWNAHGGVGRGAGWGYLSLWFLAWLRWLMAFRNYRHHC